jgi:hypothetical protein
MDHETRMKQDFANQIEKAQAERKQGPRQDNFGYGKIGGEMGNPAMGGPGNETKEQTMKRLFQNHGVPVHHPEPNYGGQQPPRHNTAPIQPYMHGIPQGQISPPWVQNNGMQNPGYGPPPVNFGNHMSGGPMPSPHRPISMVGRSGAPIPHGQNPLMGHAGGPIPQGPIPQGYNPLMGSRGQSGPAPPGKYRY